VWRLDELVHAGGEHLDPAYVDAYDAKAQFDPVDDLALLTATGLDRDSTLIDFGAGTGTLALAAAAICREVEAVDVSAAMRARLDERAAHARLTNLRTVRAGFLTYERMGDPADFAYSRNALHHLPDFWKGIALERVASALRTGGVFLLRDLVYSFKPADASRTIEAWLAQAPANQETGYTAADLATHVREEHSTYGWVLEGLLERAGFDLSRVEYSESHVFGLYLCVKR
jgi:cyclopropane fatty-acyl-phospholipid synthase-like methyltransferase